MKKIILLMVCLFFLTGCYDYQELSDMNIVNGIGISKEDDLYVVNLEMVKSSKAESGVSMETNVITAKDEVLANAINKATNNSGKKAYFKHVDLLIVSEELAKEGISDVVDYMLRDVTMSSAFFTVIAEDPEEILNTKIEEDSISSLIVDTIRYNMDTAQLDNIDIIVSNITNKRKDIALPYIELDGENIVIENIAYFQTAKMVDTIDSKIYSFLLLKGTNLDFEKDDTVVNIFKKDVKYDIQKDKIVININGMSKVRKINPDLNLEDYGTYSVVEKQINEVVYEEVMDFLEDTLKDDSDLVGMKDLYYRIWNKEKDNIPYEVNVDIKLSRNGAIYEAIHD